MNLASPSVQKVKDRAKLLIRMIGIAVCLYEMRNFSSLMGVLTGLSLSPISRLKHTWAKVPAKNLEVPCSPFPHILLTLSSFSKSSS